MLSLCLIPQSVFYTQYVVRSLQSMFYTDWFAKMELNTKEVIVHHKTTRLVKEGEDWHGLQIVRLKNLG